MPTNHVRVSTRGWTLDSLIKLNDNFCAVKRVSARADALLDIFRNHERKGIPLVIEGFHEHEKWPANMFTLEGFSGFSDSQEICVRNVHSRTDKSMDLSEFISTSRRLNQFAEDGESERFYGKDAVCPHAWEQWLCKSGVLPPSVLSHGPEDEFRFRPESSRIETLMCYLGVGDTYTPSHKDLCASSGQNLMCYTENGGSSFWFMTESSTAPEASSYFHKLGQELDHEDYVVTLDEFSKAPFRIYVLEQKLGDLVLVPPRSCHQVVNYGGVTVKTSWSRITLQGLSTAYYHELPIYRRVGRPETYRIKSTIHYALVGRTKELARRLSHGSSFPENLANAINASTYNTQTKPSRLERDAHSLLVAETKQLVHLYDSILVEERSKASYCVGHKRSNRHSFNDDNLIVCDFCECDIFQSFFECLRCKDGFSGHIICPGCYAEGRSCPCIIMQPMECRDFEVLDNTRSEAARVLRSYDVGINEDHDTNSTVPKLFHAACVVLEMRKDTRRPTKSCIIARGSDHEVPFAWGLHCRHCHRSTCFNCVLNHFKMHSAEALQLFDEDNSRVQYHEKHTLSKLRYRNSLDKLQHTQREGASVGGHLLLAHIALQYSCCIPPNLKGMEVGWYDSKIEPSNSGSSSPLRSPVHGTGMHQVPKLTFKIPAINKLPQNTQSQSSGKRRRVYVEIPPAPYRTRHKIRQTSKHEPHPLIEANQISVHLTPRVPPPDFARQATGESPNPTTSNEDIRRRENVANFKGSSTNILLTRNKTLTKSVRPTIKPFPISPLKYKENQDANRATLSRLSFKKISPTSPSEDSVAIPTPVSVDPVPDNPLGSSPSLTPPSDHNPQTPPSLGGQQFYPPPELLPYGDEPIITQLLAQIAGTSQPYPVLAADSEQYHVPCDAVSQPLPGVYWAPNAYLLDNGIPKQPDDLYQPNAGETGQSSHIGDHHPNL